MLSNCKDVLVIGGGTTGCGIAWSLARAGFKVRLLERNTIASGASGASPGIVRQYYADSALSVLAAEGLRVYREWSKIIGGDCGYHATGFLSAVPIADWARVVKRVESLQALGIEIEAISADAILGLFPDGKLHGLAGAVHEPTAGYCDAVATARALAQAAVRHGAIIEEHCTVRRFLSRQGQVEGVETDTGVLQCPLIVNAAGPWAASLSATCQATLPISASRQCVAIVEILHDEGAAGLPGYSDRERGFYLRPVATNQYMIGSLMLEDSGPIDPDCLDRQMSEAAINQFTARAETRFSRFNSAMPRGSRVSFFDDTPDGNPIVGRDPRIEGLFVVAGLSGHGFKFAPVFGQAIVQAITSKTCMAGMESFAVERFLKK
ncbi:NAD(P)/FAD-dependent oxidoreductase [Pseudomonas aeruginosa]|uniref:NAD(P)/FAD-dependent oxidoreductase n=1 Tax=Pseudomonas aeruginosa TaxID=287 RepID=UPI003CC5E858